MLLKGRSQHRIRNRNATRVSINGLDQSDPLRTAMWNWQKKLSCRRKAGQRYVSLNILLSYSRSCKIGPTQLN